MERDAIRQILQENLQNPEKENFNKQIIQKLNLEQKKQRQILFGEKSILNWFLFTSGFVLFFYLQQELKLDVTAILIGSVIAATPLYLLIFNKIHSLKNNTR